MKDLVNLIGVRKLEKKEKQTIKGGDPIPNFPLCCATGECEGVICAGQ